MIYILCSVRISHSLLFFDYLIAKKKHYFMQFFTIQLYFGLITQHIISNINNISNFGEIVRWVHFGFGWVHHFGNPPSKSTHYLLHRFSNFPFLAMVQWRSFFRTWKDFAKPIILLSLVNESKIGSRKIIRMQLHTNGFFGKSSVVMHQVPHILGIFEDFSKFHNAFKNSIILPMLFIIKYAKKFNKQKSFVQHTLQKYEVCLQWNIYQNASEIALFYVSENLCSFFF